MSSNISLSYVLEIGTVLNGSGWEDQIPRNFYDRTAVTLKIGTPWRPINRLEIR